MRQPIPILLAVIASLVGCDPEGIGDPPDDDTTYEEPTWCGDVCAACAVDDGTPLLDEAPPWEPRSLRLLVVTPSVDDAVPPDVRTLLVFLEGVGVGFDTVPEDSFSSVDLSTYSSVLVASSSWGTIDLGETDCEALAGAVEAGMDLMWLGLGSESLADTFGVSAIDEVSTAEMGFSSFSFADVNGDVVEAPLYDDFLTWVEPLSAEVWATFEPGGDPAVTVRRSSSQAGRAVLAPFGLLDYWGEDDEDHTWARSEVLYELLWLLRSRGAAALGPFPDGHASAFLVRVEDIHPGGTRFFLYEEWIDRFLRVGDWMFDREIPLHLGVVARFVDPTEGEDFGWDDPDDTRQRLRGEIVRRLSLGDELISHGWTHQYGDGEDDYTGVDWEFSDDASGDWEFLPYAEQLPRVQAARDELAAAFSVAPDVWETPHLDGNADTYHAAAEVGFTVVNEGDGHLFPNRWGEENRVDDALLNVPHTGSFVPYEDPGSFVDVSLQSVMPRLLRIHAPFFVFYHGYTDEQEQALLEVAACSPYCGLWQPRITEFADWWELRGLAFVETALEGDDRLVVVVSEHPAGATLDVRLPDGMDAGGVTVSGESISFTATRRGGLAHVRLVLPDAGTETRIEITATTP